MTRLSLSLAAAATLLACFGPVPPTQRALECNELCAQYIGLGNLQAAEDQCDLAVQFSPQYADPWVNKAVIAKKRGQTAKSKELLIKALRLNNHQSQGYNNLGLIYLEELAFGKAHDNFQHALNINPDYIEARYNLGLAFKGLGDHDNARKAFRTLLHVRPDVADAWAQLGALDMEDGDFEDALESLNKAVQLDPAFTGAWVLLGNLHMELGKPCDAKDSFTSCIEINAESPECRNNIIIAEKKCQLQQKALDDVKARAAGEKTPASEYSLALEARENGRTSDEERSFNRCLKYDKKYALCYFGLFELHRRMADEKKATVDCKNFLKFANETEFPTQVATCKQYVND